MIYDLFKGKKSVEMEYLYVCTTYAITIIALQRLSLFALQGNLQIDGGSTTYNVMGAMHLGQKLIEVIKDIDFFKETKMYDDEI